jgi:hypothetical protein
VTTTGNHLEEWKECRTSIGRFDQGIVDIRKYAFTLLTGLLTGSAFLSSTAGLPPEGRELVAVAMMLLVFSLFTIDRYLAILLRSAVERAKKLEDELDLHLTRTIATRTERAGADSWGVLLYPLFIFASALLPLTTTRPQGYTPLVTYWGYTVFEVLLFVYHKKTSRELRQSTRPHICQHLKRLPALLKDLRSAMDAAARSGDAVARQCHSKSIKTMLKNLTNYFEQQHQAPPPRGVDNGNT